MQFICPADDVCKQLEFREEFWEGRGRSNKDCHTRRPLVIGAGSELGGDERGSSQKAGQENAARAAVNQLVRCQAQLWFLFVFIFVFVCLFDGLFLRL